MLLPKQDEKLKSGIKRILNDDTQLVIEHYGEDNIAVTQAYLNDDSAVSHILDLLEKLGYHKGLPSSIEEALNSGDGTYRP